MYLQATVEGERMTESKREGARISVHVREGGFEAKAADTRRR